MGLNGLPFFNYFLADLTPLPYNRMIHGNCSERAIEVPLAIRFLQQNYSGHKNPFLEIGNVFSYYEKLFANALPLKKRIILDLFTQGPKMLRGYKQKHDLIVCLSTVQKIGQDPYALPAHSNRETPLLAIQHIYNLLKSSGKAFITVPFGKLMDQHWFIQFDSAYLRLLTTKFGMPANDIKVSYYKKEDMEMHFECPKQHWKQCSEEELQGVLYDTPFMFANGIAVLELSKNGADVHFPPLIPEPFAYKSPAIVPNAYFPPFVRPFPFDQEGNYPADQAGYIFYGHSFPLFKGSYLIHATLQILGAGEFILELVSDAAQKPLWQYSFTKSETISSAFFLKENKNKVELRLYKQNIGSCKVKIPLLTLTREEKQL